MMQRQYIVSFLMLLFLFSACLSAQETPRPVVLAPALGDTVDAVEREWYQLLPPIPGFEHAVCYLNPDSTLNARVTLMLNERRTDTTVQLRRSLLFIRNQIAQMEINHGFPEGDANGRKDRMLRAGDGRRVIVEMRDRSTVRGELISVRDGAIVLNTGAPGDSAVCSGNAIAIVDMISMLTITVPAKHPVGTTVAGIVVGALVGGLLSYLLISSLVENDAALFDRPKVPVPVYFFGGVAAGAILGYLIVDEPDEEWDAQNPPDRFELRKYARYPYREPACLSAKR